MEKVSDLQLEQFALGELSPSETRRVQEELSRDSSLRDRLSALHESDQAILREYPPERIVPLIRERVRARQPQRRAMPRWVSGAIWALPAAAVLVLALSVGVFRPETRAKGLTPHLTLFIQTATGAQELAAGASAGRGDRIQLSYTAPGVKYAAIVSVDGRGTITWHFPAGYSGGAASAPPVSTEGRTVLPSSYELDDAPGF
jgi:anti-sigma-K factor RskA